MLEIKLTEKRISLTLKMIRVRDSFSTASIYKNSNYSEIIAIGLIEKSQVQTQF